MDVGGTVMREEVGGRIERSVRHTAGCKSPPSLFTYFAKKKKKYYFEREGIRTKLLFQQQSLLKSTLPSEELFGFLQVLMEISFEG